MYRKIFILVIVLMVCVVGVALSNELHKYIGVKKCSMCHKSDAKGNQHKIWLSMKHSKAYKTLETHEAKETAKKAGVSVDPTVAPECLRCHVTAYGVDASLLGSGFNKEDGVQCESCHGAGGDYYKMSVMKDKALSIEKGLVVPTKEVCVKCHNEESPNFPGFDFDKSFICFY